jgi:hypothetical protein
MALAVQLKGGGVVLTVEAEAQHQHQGHHLQLELMLLMTSRMNRQEKMRLCLLQGLSTR